MWNVFIIFLKLQKYQKNFLKLKFLLLILVLTTSFIKDYNDKKKAIEFKNYNDNKLYMLGTKMKFQKFILHFLISRTIMIAPHNFNKLINNLVLHNIVSINVNFLFLIT